MTSLRSWHPQKDGKALRCVKSPLGLSGRMDIFKESSSLEGNTISSRKCLDPENGATGKTRPTLGPCSPSVVWVWSPEALVCWAVTLQSCGRLGGRCAKLTCAGYPLWIWHGSRSPQHDQQMSSPGLLCDSKALESNLTLLTEGYQ